MIRVLIVDDHPLFRGGLVALLRTVPDIDIVDAVGVGQRAVRSAVELAPDIIVMDLNLPGISGMEAIRRILAHDPGARVLVLTMVDDDNAVTAALRVGARGYVLKGAGQEEVPQHSAPSRPAARSSEPVLRRAFSALRRVTGSTSLRVKRRSSLSSERVRTMPRPRPASG
jgi:DNA-binding NarL/FixJ family response regulator